MAGPPSLSTTSLPLTMLTFTGPVLPLNGTDEWNAPTACEDKMSVSLLPICTVIVAGLVSRAVKKTLSCTTTFALVVGCQGAFPAVPSLEPAAAGDRRYQNWSFSFFVLDWPVL